MPEIGYSFFPRKLILIKMIIFTNRNKNFKCILK